jgi:hypothetical protein
MTLMWQDQTQRDSALWSLGRMALNEEWHLLNSYPRAIDPPTRVASCGKRREYVRVGSTAAFLPPIFPTEATRIGLSKCHSSSSYSCRSGFSRD